MSEQSEKLYTVNEIVLEALREMDAEDWRRVREVKEAQSVVYSSERMKGFNLMRDAFRRAGAAVN